MRLDGAAAVHRSRQHLGLDLGHPDDQPLGAGLGRRSRGRLPRRRGDIGRALAEDEEGADQQQQRGADEQHRTEPPPLGPFFGDRRDALCQAAEVELARHPQARLAQQHGVVLELRPLVLDDDLLGADEDLVARGERRLGDLAAIEQSAVGAPQVGQLEAVAFVGDQRVPLRGPVVVHHEVRVWRAADDVAGPVDDLQAPPGAPLPIDQVEGRRLAARLRRRRHGRRHVAGAQQDGLGGVLLDDGEGERVHAHDHRRAVDQEEVRHLGVTDLDAVGAAEIDDLPGAELADDLRVVPRRGGGVEHHVVVGIAPDADAGRVEAQLLTLSLRVGDGDADHDRSHGTYRAASAWLTPKG